ncbi:hypothetical protein ACRALDRAFT_1071639 [Sodiomyces alcalophilus JCM 7366]|uniref:uncharacterized protein n=1 Tax=Sodiomyces alcalophilus JCM 7366 TaxID=591952 RepID=UPI0039B4B263
MARGRNYTSEQIRFILEAILRKERANEIISSYQKRFQKTLRPQQVRYVRTKYGNDPAFNTCLVNQVVKKRKAYDSDSDSSSSVHSSPGRRDKRRKTTGDRDTELNARSSNGAASTKPGATPPSPPQASTVPSVPVPPPEIDPVLHLFSQPYEGRVPTPLIQTPILTSSYPQLLEPSSEPQTAQATQQKPCSQQYPRDGFPSIDQTVASCCQRGGGSRPDPTAVVNDSLDELLGLGCASKSTSQKNPNSHPETATPLPYAGQTCVSPTPNHDDLLRQQLGSLQSPRYSLRSPCDNSVNSINSNHGEPPQLKTPQFSPVSPQPQTCDFLPSLSAYITALLPDNNAAPEYDGSILPSTADHDPMLQNHQISYDLDITFPAPTYHQQDIPLDPELLRGGQYFPDQEDATAAQWDQTGTDADPIDWQALFDASAQVTTTPTERWTLGLDDSIQDILSVFEEMENAYQPSNDKSAQLGSALADSAEQDNVERKSPTRCFLTRQERM